MKEVLRASLGKCRDTAVSGLPHLVERVCTRKVDYVNRRFGHFGYRYRAVDTFCLSDRRTCQSVIFRSGTAVGENAFNDLVDDDTIFRVHANQAATLAGGRH